MRRYYVVGMVLWAILVCSFAAPLTAQSLGGDVLFYTGYFAHKNGAEVSFSRPPAANTVASLQHKYDLNGIWLEALVPMGCGPLGFALGGAVLVPFDQRSGETMYGQGSGVVERNWLADSQWWYLQTRLTYEVLSGVAGVVGFRYDNFQTNFWDPSRELPGGDTITDKANLTINAYIPYFGLMLSSISTGAGVGTKIGVVGFPALPGSVDFSELGQFQFLGTSTRAFSASNGFGSGYFLEGYADAIVPFTPWCQLGAFIRFTTINGRATINVGERDARIPDVDYAFDYTRKSWIVGGLIGLSF